MEKTIVLIGCGKKKLPHRAKAKDLYQGSLFCKSWMVARKEYPKASRHILSAKHYLLDPEKEIEPYNETLKGKRVADKKAWAESVIARLRGSGYDLQNDKFVFFAGNDYTKYLISPLGPIRNYKLIYDGYRGIGLILKSLNDVLQEVTKDFNGSNLESAKDIRKEIETEGFVAKQAGVYRLWVRSEAAEALLANLDSEVEIHKLQKMQIGETDYSALYFGMSKNLWDRLKWHILQKHDPKTVESGAISTLRHTLSAILFKNTPLTATEDDLNDWMDKNCLFEWEYMPGKSMAAYVEDEELSRNYYPLNIMDNNLISDFLRKEIKQLRKVAKK